MQTKLIAHASVSIATPVTRVWDALTNPEAIRQYMFGTHVVSEWRKGSTITWTGEWEGTSYEDKGVILRLEPHRALQYTHYSPRSGLPDRPRNYHTVTIELDGAGNMTHVSLTQDNNSDEQAREHSEKNWGAMLVALKRFLER
jgi:uncharacterized protein YndB with AHSA1/START domain